jgi:hypothetical protein
MLAYENQLRILRVQTQILLQDMMAIAHECSTQPAQLITNRSSGTVLSELRWYLQDLGS